MTVPATTRRAGPFNGNGATTAFPFTFKVFAKTDVQALLTTATGLSSTLVQDSDYSVTLNVDQDSTPGGTITYPITGTALASGEKLTVLGALDYEQTTDLPAGGAYRASVVEDALDRATIQVQQLAEEVGRALTLPASAATADTELPVPEAGKVIAWNSDGTGLVNVDSADLASVVVAGTAYTDIFSGTGAQTAFTLTANPGGVNALDVAISGVSQVNGVDFTVSGTTLTFTSAPPSGTGNIAVRYVAAVPIGSANAQDVTFNPAGAGAVATTVQAKLRRVVEVEDFGAVGDGVTDTTALIQAALSSGAKTVRCSPGSTYLVGYAGTVTVAATAQRYCLLVPTGVILDLNGATIKAKAASNASPVMLYSVTDSGVINGTIDCNKSNQTTPATGEIAGVYAYGCTRPRVDGVRAINCRMYAGRFLGNTGGRYRGLWCSDSDGDGWSFGVTGTAGELREFEAEIDDIHAESCTASYGGSFQGNPALFCTKNANTGKVVGKYSAGGIKVQDMAEDSNFGLLTFIGQTNGTANSGVKVQGNGAGLQPKRIKIAAINSTSAYGNGLYIADALSVEVGQYHGLSNGTGASATGSDKHDFNIDVPAGGRVIIGAIDVETPAAQFGRAFGAGYCKIGTMAGKTPTGIGFSYNGTGEFDADDIRCNDAGSAMTYAFQATGGKGHIKSLSTDKAHSTTQSRAIVNTGLYDWTIDRLRLGSADVLEGAVQLTNTATSTSVTCGHIWTEYVGGAADNFTPIIQIVPMETTARALGAMYAVPVTGSSGTGFAIKHAAAGAGNYVAWKVIGWKTLNRPFA